MLLAADEPVLLPDRHIEDCAGPGCGGVLRVLVPRPLTETDWAALLEPVARELLGDPVRRPASGEWRYRRKGSLAVHVAGPRRGTWRDHEADVGGGVLELLAHVEGLARPEALVVAASPGAVGWPPDGPGAWVEPFLGPGWRIGTPEPRKTLYGAHSGTPKPRSGRKAGCSP